MSTSFHYQRLKDEKTRSAVIQWWKQLHGLHDNNQHGGNQRGARAELRRCDSLDSVLLSEGFRQLWELLGQTGQRRNNNIMAWSCVAAALAEVREQPTTGNASFAQCLGGQKEKTGKPRVSELRFSQLQKSRSENDFLRRLRRVLALLNRSAPVLSLADDILHWFHEQQGPGSLKPTDRLAVRWATDYFTALSAY